MEVEGAFYTVDPPPDLYCHGEQNWSKGIKLEGVFYTVDLLSSLSYHGLKRRYLRVRRDARLVDRMLFRLQSMTNYLAAFKTMEAKVRVLLRFGNFGDLVELALLFAFQSLKELVQGLESAFPGSKNLLVRDEDRLTNNPHLEAQLELQNCAAQLDSGDGGSTTTRADNTVGSESVLSESDEPEATTEPTESDLYHDEVKDDDEENAVFNHGPDLLGGHIPRGVGGPPHTVQENAQEPFASNVDYVADSSGSDQGNVITIRQNYAPWEVSDIGGKIEAATEEIKLHCATECAGRGSRHLHFHRGHTKTIGRWRPGSTIRYSINYSSFFAAGRSLEDVIYALESLQAALEIYNSLDLDVQFEFVEPDTSPVVFELKCITEPWGGPVHIRRMVFARSFFPVDTVEGRPCELYVFNAAFDTAVRPHMMKIFLHEAAHILGGRHEDAATAEQDEPSVQLGPRNSSSVLVTNRHPSTISLHSLDIAWFRLFMILPEGYRIDGFPICDIAP